MDRSWADHIPVAVNDTYGDPFIIERVSNTLDKTNQLMTQKAPIAIFTKAPLDARVIPYLWEIAVNPMVIAFYSLTGLDEGDYEAPRAVSRLPRDWAISSRPMASGSCWMNARPAI